MKYGLSEKQLDQIIKIISSYKEVEKAILFGSRAIDTYKEASDVDIAIMGENCDLLLAAIIKDHLEEETYLPFFFDIIAYNSVKSPELKKHIKSKGKVIFQREEKWREVKLGEIIDLNYGKSLVSSKRIDGDIPVYSSAGITGYHNIPLVNSKGLIVGRKGTIGTVYKSDIPFYCIDTAYYILPDDGKYNFNFMYYLLQTLGLKNLNSDSAVPGLNRNTAYDQSFMFPPLPEQKAIAEVLSSLDDKIDLLHRQNKTLEKMAETLFRQWFIEERDEDWEEKCLEEILSISSSKRIYYKEYVKIGVPFYRSKEIIELSKGGKTSTELFISENRFNEIKTKFGSPKHGDILVTSVGTLGVSYRVKVSDKFYFKDGNLTWFSNFKLLPSSIIFCWLNSSFGKEALNSISIGSTQAALTISGLRQINITIPPEAIIYKLNLKLEGIYTKIDFNQKQIQNLEQLRNTILPKLMSGEAKVK